MGPVPAIKEKGGETKKKKNDCERRYLVAVESTDGLLGAVADDARRQRLHQQQLPFLELLLFRLEELHLAIQRHGLRGCRRRGGAVRRRRRWQGRRRRVGQKRRLPREWVDRHQRLRVAHVFRKLDELGVDLETVANRLQLVELVLSRSIELVVAQQDVPVVAAGRRQLDVGRRPGRDRVVDAHTNRLGEVAAGGRHLVKELLLIVRGEHNDHAPRLVLEAGHQLSRQHQKAAVLVGVEHRQSVLWYRMGAVGGLGLDLEVDRRARDVGAKVVDSIVKHLGAAKPGKVDRLDKRLVEEAAAAAQDAHGLGHERGALLAQLGEQRVEVDEAQAGVLGGAQRWHLGQRRWEPRRRRLVGRARRRFGRWGPWRRPWWRRRRQRRCTRRRRAGRLWWRAGGAGWWARWAGPRRWGGRSGWRAGRGGWEVVAGMEGAEPHGLDQPAQGRGAGEECTKEGFERLRRTATEATAAGCLGSEWVGSTAAPRERAVAWAGSVVGSGPA